MVAISSRNGTSQTLNDSATPLPVREATMSPSRRRRRASPEWEGRDIITVAALPGRGLYVRHLGHPEGVDGVHRPTVVLPGSAPRPPASFDVTWLTEQLGDMQVVHVHGIAPRVSPGQVTAAAAAVKAAGRPLVVTAYHLSDPSGTDEANYAAQLDVLIPAADEVMTITESAREEISRRWSVDATVLPHPHVVDFVRMRRARSDQRRGPFVLGAHLGSLRLPGDPVAVVGALAQAAAEVPDVRLDLHVHDHLLDPDSTRYNPVTIREIERIVTKAGGTVRAHRPMTDAQLWDHLFSLDASFVPPLHGSHSIWPEACYDLGTQVLLPAGSHAAAQRPGLSYTADASGVPNVKSLQAAIAQARDQDTCWRADPTARWKERVRIAEALRTSYEKLLAQRI
jgi:beta-1,4-mannosyltransferase